ncbi:dihydropteroate synthase [bacterium]|nr:dihydropteroate synthase [bacterium]
MSETQLDAGKTTEPEVARTWLIGDSHICCDRPVLMAIVNATPDSFYAGSRVAGDPAARRNALAALVEERPAIIDVGGQSTRPGSERVGAEEEIRRVIPVIREILEIEKDALVSIDTYHSKVAREALFAGARIVNDISAGRMDANMWDVLAEHGCGYVLMHMQGTPGTMQQAPHYEDCAGEVNEFFTGKLKELQACGIDSKRVVLDPGIGFGKRLADNLELIKRARSFARLKRPLMYGVSRKSFIGRIARRIEASDDPANRLAGTLGITWELLNKGVMLHRVHDVRETRQLVAAWEALSAGSNVA